MGLKNGKNIFFLFLVFALMFFVGCSNDTNSTQTNNSGEVDGLATRLYMISGETGSLAPAADDNEYVITLQDVSSGVHWIADRPGRESGMNETDNFFQTIWPGIFAETAPNAIVKILRENESNGLFLALKEPVYNAGQRTVSFTAILLNATFEEGDSLLLETMEFEDPVIVILNNGDGFNFVVHSESATIETPGPENIFTIIQDDIDDEVLWASGAPSTLSRVTTTERLKENWDAFFSNAPPNAFIFGITSAGRLHGYSLTLEGMEYSPGDTRISYPASILDDNPIENERLNSVTLVIDNLDDIPMACIEYCNTKISCLDLPDTAVEKAIADCNDECITSQGTDEIEDWDCLLSCDTGLYCSDYLACLCACGMEIACVCD